MHIKTRRQVLTHRSDRALVHLGLLLLCLMLSALGLGFSALWCFIPAAALVELLSLASPRANVRRM